VAPPRRATARTAALPARRPPSALRRHMPSARSIAVGLALLGLAVGAYAIARETSVFAVRDIEVRGGSAALRAEVARALRPELGRSLVGVGGADVAASLADVPGVLSVRTDRRFPHTLRVVVTPERPVLLLRRGKAGWVVSARGRVLSRVRHTNVSSLPRLWVPKQTWVKVGMTLAPASGRTAATVVAPIVGSRFPAHIRAVRAKGDELTLVLRSGLELRLGDPGDLLLKLAVARKMLLLEGPDTSVTYIDVSVPERPVVGGGNAQVAGQG